MHDFDERLEDARRAKAGETILPEFRKDAFHCIYCAVLAAHFWTPLHSKTTVGTTLSAITRATCTNCHRNSYWLESEDGHSEMIWPPVGGGPLPHDAMPEDVREDYEEAREIVQESPRGAAALLRLALQKLMPHVGQSGENLNDDIGSLVASGLDRNVQRALDALRVIGNNAVHPGELSLKDDAETAQGLFTILNFVVEQLIELPRRRCEAMYEALPESARIAIEKRDLPASQ